MSARGAIVRVSLGRRRLAGVVTEVASEASVAREKLLPIDEVVALPPLPDDVRDLCTFVATYYQEPLGLAFALAMPPLQRTPETSRRRAPTRVDRLGAYVAAHSACARTRRASAVRADRARGRGAGPGCDRSAFPGGEADPPCLARSGLRATGADAESHRRAPAAQRCATRRGGSDRRRRGTFAPFLLHGVTGSGKTEVYLDARPRTASRAGGQVLMLVPEINLTPQLVARVRAALPGARTVDAAQRACRPASARATGARPRTGTRGSRARYAARGVHADAARSTSSSSTRSTTRRTSSRTACAITRATSALWRAPRRGVPVVLGSATPSLESLRTRATRAATGGCVLPRRADPRARRRSCVSCRRVATRVDDGIGDPLLGAIAARLDRGEQSLVFVNRRGFAPSLICSRARGRPAARAAARGSSSIAMPRDCAVIIAAIASPLPAACPQCGNVDLVPLGHGTQRLERALAARFPDARIARVDRDSTRRKGAFADVRVACAANDGRHPRRHADARQGTRLPAAHAGRRARRGQRALQRAISARPSGSRRCSFRWPGARDARSLPGEVIVQTDFPTHPLYARAVTTRLRRFRARAARGAARCSACRRSRISRCSPRKRTAARTSTPSSRCAHSDGERQAIDVVRRRSKSSRRCRRCWRAAPASSAAQMLLRSERRGELQRFLPRWRDVAGRVPRSRACAGRSTSIRRARLARDATAGDA